MKKKNKKPQIVFVDLPEKDTNVYVSALFSYGYFNESPKWFGTGHLLEHYLSFRAEKELSGPISHSTISNHLLGFAGKTKKGELYHVFSKALEIFKNDPITDEILLKREKARIKIELDERYSRSELVLSWGALQALYTGSQKIVRKRTEQNTVVPNISLRDLRALRSNLLDNHFIGFVIGGYKLPKALKDKIKATFDAATPTAHVLPAVMPQAVVSRTKRKLIKFSGIEKGYAHISIMWPGLSMKDKLAARFALGHLCRQLRDKLEEPLGDIGIYKFDYEYIVSDTYGYVRFHGYAPKKETYRFESAIYEALHTLLIEKKLLQSGIKKYIIEHNQKTRKAWKNNIEKNDWIIDDLVDFGEIMPPSLIIAERNKVSSVLVHLVAKRVFNPRTQHTFVATSTSE